MDWYYTQDGVQQGPVSREELVRLAREGGLDAADFVWNEGMGDRWERADSVPGLFGSRLRPTAARAVEGAGAPAEPTLPATSLTRREREAVAARGPISCSAAVGPARRRMSGILFAPFDLGKWFVLGFTAWLANLGQGGGGNLNLGDATGSGGSSEGSGGAADFEGMLQQVQDFLREHAAMMSVIVTVVIAAVAVGFVVGLVMLWIKSRGKFMFLDNVVNDRSEVSLPWKAYARQGNSLFKWNILYALACLSVVLLIFAVAFFTAVLPCLKARSLTPAALPGFVISGFLLLLFAIVTGYVGRFLEDFIVPIMYQFDLTATEAWRRFGGLYRGCPGKFIVYGLFYMLLGLVALLVLGLLVLVTCCIAGCLMAIPYLGSVVLLPFSVFFRCYSLEFLAQFGPEYAVLPEEA